MVDWNQWSHRKTRDGQASLLVGVLILGLMAVPARALLVTVNLGWTAPLSNFNLQEGSVIQIIMYDSTGSYPDPADPEANFGSPFGTYGGDPPLYADPFDSGTQHIPESTAAYDPLGTPEGHIIAYTTSIGANLGGWYNTIAQFEVLGTYDRLYIRVFGTTEIGQQGFWASYWGLSDVYTNTGSVYTWFVDPIDNVAATNKNYFHVIPEPGTMALSVLGAFGLWIGRRRREQRLPVEKS